MASKRETVSEKAYCLITDKTKLMAVIPILSSIGIGHDAIPESERDEVLRLLSKWQDKVFKAIEKIKITHEDETD